MKVRKATTKDMPAIRALIGLYPDKLMQNHLPKAAEFFVALDDKKLVGCCALEIYSKRLAEVRSLAISPSAQKQGIATSLVEHCVQHAKRKHIYEILAITGATGFFEKQGFQSFRKEKYALLKTLG